eukprot:jgi/Botrbrau1/12258/Bobra.0323s0001.1
MGWERVEFFALCKGLRDSVCYPVSSVNLGLYTCGSYGFWHISWYSRRWMRRDGTPVISCKHQLRLFWVLGSGASRFLRLPFPGALLGLAKLSKEKSLAISINVNSTCRGAMHSALTL